MPAIKSTKSDTVKPDASQKPQIVYQYFYNVVETDHDSVDVNGVRRTYNARKFSDGELVTYALSGATILMVLALFFYKKFYRGRGTLAKQDTQEQGPKRPKTGQKKIKIQMTFDKKENQNKPQSKRIKPYAITTRVAQLQPATKQRY